MLVRSNGNFQPLLDRGQDTLTKAQLWLVVIACSTVVPHDATDTLDALVDMEATSSVVVRLLPRRGGRLGRGGVAEVASARRQHWIEV